MGLFGIQELIIIAIIVVPVILATVFWIWVLVDCIKNEPDSGNNKVLWVVVIALAGWIGALVYLLARRPARLREVGR